MSCTTFPNDHVRDLPVQSPIRLELFHLHCLHAMKSTTHDGEGVEDAWEGLALVSLDVFDKGQVRFVVPRIEHLHHSAISLGKIDRGERSTPDVSMGWDQLVAFNLGGERSHVSRPDQ